MSQPPHPRGYEEALAEHAQLHALNDDLTRFLDGPRPEPADAEAHPWATALYRRLVALHETVSSHFRSEESGLLDQLRLSHPEASNRLEEITSDHARILGRLRSLVDDAMRYAEARRPDEPRLRRRVRDLLAEIGQHETKETELIQDLLWTDIGPGD